MQFNIPIIILAGGSSSRMQGSDKLLERVNGISLLRDRALECLKSTSGSVLVIIPREKDDRYAAISDLKVTTVLTEGSHLGISHSLNSGLSRIKGPEVLILLADLVKITHVDILNIFKVAKKSNAPIIRGVDSNGVAGHPVLIRRKIIDKFKTLSGDIGGNLVLNHYICETRLVKLPGTNATFDLDTPEDWKNWKNKTRTNCTNYS